jgi:hypothetical protein
MEADARVQDGVEGVDDDVGDTTAVDANRTMPMITGRSCWLIASTAVLPRPGRLKT